MNQRQRALLSLVSKRLRGVGLELFADGWDPQLIVFSPREIERIPGYKVGLIVPLDGVVLPQAPSTDGDSQEGKSAPIGRPIP